jgi:hypothetical protein
MNKLVKVMFCFALLTLCEVAIAEDSAIVTGSSSSTGKADNQF